MRTRCVVVATMGLAVLLSCRSEQSSRPAPSATEAERVRKLGFRLDSPKGLTRALQATELAPVRLDLRASLSVGRQQQVLALSGGGQWGAFGAGFLKGWTRRGDRPEAFQIVTGTSTGSLISTFAFLGRDYDDAVGRAYLEIRGDDDVMEKRFLLTALFSDALATTKGLRRLIERHVTGEMVAKVAAEARKGRRLYVGAVDVDLGIFKPFNLTEIASRGGSTARKEFIDALMASTAIPVAFPPVVIDGHTYVDGGVRRNVFLELLVGEMGPLRLQRSLTAQEATVYCLINGSLDVGAEQHKRRVLDIAKRSVDVLLDESTDGNLLRIYLQAQKAQLQFLMTRIPPGMCSAVGSEENQFDPNLIKCLYAQGQRFAQLDRPWTSEPPLAESVP